MPAAKSSKKKQHLHLVNVDRDKCNNCHTCISACPVKACIDGSGYRIDIIHERCLGCGSCVLACRRHARTIADDTHDFFTAIEDKTPLVAMVAPSAVTAFPDIYKLNGYLKSLGVQAVFDVSFGAELAAQSYLDYIERKNPRVIISQPCAALVTFCEVYHPELLQFLAPVHSPMLHTAIMIKEFFPEYKNAKIAAISPCIAKKREFVETGLVDFNVTMVNLKHHLELNFIDLSSFKSCDFDGPAAERAVNFSSPGGLKATIIRDAPHLEQKIRKIEGEHTVYKYLTDIPQMLLEKNAPQIVDCLSCATGCNGGIGTGNYGIPLERLESKIAKRMEEHIERSRKITEEKIRQTERARNEANYFYGEDHKIGIQEVVSKFWKPHLYRRGYINRNSLISNFKVPTIKEINIIYKQMKKRRDEDFLNCAACGYGSCSGMATAIFNELNRPENCHQYLSIELEVRSRLLYETFGRYLSTDVVASLLESPQSAVALGGRKRNVTIMMSDLRNFSSISEIMDVHKVVEMLNHYFSLMVEVINNYQGTVIEFLGDGILSVFGAPTDTPNHADDAIACAIEMQNAMGAVNKWNHENDYPPIAMGIGINTGECIVGNIGSEKIMKYNVIGRHVNLCGRIESYTSGGQIYISENTLANVKSELKISHHERVHPKGLPAATIIYLVDGIGFPYNLNKKSVRAPLKILPKPLRLEYRRIEEKVIDTEPYKCMLLAISRSEAILGCDGMKVLDNIKLTLNSGGGEEVFAKVTRKVKEQCYRVSFTADSRGFYHEVFAA